MARLAFGIIDRQRSGRYRARYTHPERPTNADGSPNRVAAPTTFARKGDAQTWLAGVQAAIAKGEWKSPEEVQADKIAAQITAARDAMTFGDYAAQWMRTRDLRPTTRRAYDSMLRNHLLPAWGTTPLRAITTAALRAWLAEVAPDRPTVRRRAYELLSTILATAADDELIAVSPCKRNMLATVTAATTTGKAPHRKGPQALSAAQLDALADEVPAYLRVPVLLAGTVGLRSGELRALTGDSVRILPSGDTVLHVTRAVTGHGERTVVGPPKTDRSVRTVPVPASLVDEISALAVAAGRDGWLFHPVGDARRVIPERTFQENLAAAGERLGLGRVTPHVLRHTAASRARAAGAAATEVRDLLGHTTTAMTDHYTHTAADQLARLVDVLDRERTHPAVDNVVPMSRKVSA